MRRHKFAAFAIVLSTAWLLAPGGVSRAQDPEKATPNAVLKRRIEETWRVVPLQHGLLLVPRRASVRVKGIELGETGIAVDARPVTGSELVARLGADADAVMQLSYLASDERAALFAEPEAPAVERPREMRRQPRPIPMFEPEIRHVYRGARVRVFGPVTVRDGEQVGDVVAVFGSVDLQGAATGDVVSVFGDIDMGPKASVQGNVVSIGGVLRTADGATTIGKLTEVRIGWPDIQITVPGDDRFSMRITPDWPRIARWQWVSGLVGALLLLAICAFTVLVAPGAVAAAANPGRSMFVSALVGLAIQVLLLPAIVLIASALTLSVIGIPLLAGIPMLLLALAIAALVGFTGVAARVGSVWRPGGQASASILAVVFGLAAIWATGLTGRYLWAMSGGVSPWGMTLAAAGAAIEYTCWTIGLGSAVLAWRSRKVRRAASVAVMSPPPVPVDL